MWVVQTTQRIDFVLKGRVHATPRNFISVNDFHCVGLIEDIGMWRRIDRHENFTEGTGANPFQKRVLVDLGQAERFVRVNTRSSCYAPGHGWSVALER